MKEVKATGNCSIPWDYTGARRDPFLLSPLATSKSIAVMSEFLQQELMENKLDRELDNPRGSDSTVCPFEASGSTQSSAPSQSKEH